MLIAQSPRSVNYGAVYTEPITCIRFPITFFFLILDQGEALVPEAAAVMEKGSASIIIEQKIYYFCRW